MGRTLLVIGLGIACVGLLLMLAPKSLAWLGRLPGDIRIERPGFAFYFPLATSLLLSALVSAVLWMIGRMK